MKLKLLFFLLFIITFAKAQENSELKNFINKNNVAIHSVQKNLMTQGNPSYLATFKELLKNQELAVKAFRFNESASAYLALLVRKECLDFLRKNSTKSISYFELTESEKSLPNVKDGSQSLSAEETKLIENINPLDPQQLNNLTLTVQ